MRLRPTSPLWAIVLIATHVADAGGATSALQPAPSTLQQAQPTFGAAVEPADTKAATRKRIESFGLKPPASQPAANGAIKTPTAMKGGAAKAAKKLFDMDDRTIIIVSGKQTTAGELKRKLHAEIAAKNGPPKTVKGGARKLDLAALNVTASARTALYSQAATAKGGLLPHAPVLLANQSLTQVRQSAKTSTAGMTIDESNSYSSQKCLDKGPPVISEIKGTLKVGGQVAVWGRCFGDRPGRVEIIGQFPGGKLLATFAAWDSGAVTLAIPGNISGATDHTVAVSVVTADGKVSPAMQARFVAARVRVDVPDRLWSPSAGFENSTAGKHYFDADAGKTGQAAKSLRVNPQCALDAMETSVVVGAVSNVRGWEAGPANEASVAIDWTASCIETRTTYKFDPVIGASSEDVDLTYACRVAFQARAWAYCPVGIAP